MLAAHTRDGRVGAATRSCLVFDRRKTEVRERRIHGPAADSPTERLKDDGQIEEARQGRHVGDVGQPKPVRCLSRKLTVDKVRRRTRRSGAADCGRLLAPPDARQAGLSHESGDPLTTYQNPVASQLGLVRSHKPEDPFGPVSRANQAGALPGSPAPRAAGDCRDAGVAALRAPPWSVRQRGGPRPGPPDIIDQIVAADSLMETGRRVQWLELRAERYD